MSEDVTLDEFEAGTTYEVELGDESLPLTLKAAIPLPQSVRPGGSFVLDFRGPAEPIFGQGVYRLRKGEKSWEMFLVPHAPEADGAVYHATYN
ncbi:MAG: DUF6916 family protein [Allosphingosinicella sp.]